MISKCDFLHVVCSFSQLEDESQVSRLTQCEQDENECKVRAANIVRIGCPNTRRYICYLPDRFGWGETVPELLKTVRARHPDRSCFSLETIRTPSFYFLNNKTPIVFLNNKTPSFNFAILIFY